MSRNIVFVSFFSLLLLILVSLNVTAQDQLGSTDLLVFEVGEHDQELNLREEVEHKWSICNTGSDSYYVKMDILDFDSDFSTSIDPVDLTALPDGSDQGCQDIVLTVTAPSSGEETVDQIGVDMTATNLRTSATSNETYFTVNRLTGITAPDSPEGKLFVLFWSYDNPMPFPLDNKYGAFLISFLIWVLFAVFVVAIANSLARRVAHTETHVDDIIVGMMRGPIFVLIIVLSLDYSTRILAPPSEIQTNLTAIFGAMSILLLIWLGYRLFKDVLMYYGRVMSIRTQSDIDDRLIPVISKLGGVVIVIVGVIFFLQSFGFDLTLFLMGMGFMGIVIGFAAKDSLANFFSGIFLMLDRPFKARDLIILESGEVCEVAWVGLRSTKLYHLASHEMIVLPNAVLAENKITNITAPDRRFRTSVDIGVAYGTDLDHVKSVLTDIVQSHTNVLKGKGLEPTFRVREFADSSINVRIIFWVDVVDNKWRVESELKELIDKRFKAEGIDIPFPQSVVYVHQETKM